jgi:electron transport complex protein RnfB
VVAAVITLLAMGLAFGGLLALAARKFAVEVDPRVEAVQAALPGANCGACGYAGCSDFAEAAVRGQARPDGCPAGGPELALRLAQILGRQVEAREREVAQVLCAGGHREAPDRAVYSGIRDCRAANLIAGGPKGCGYGCLGMGTCVRACRFDAIHMNADGLPEVLEDRCTGCTACVKACPRAIIVMAPVSRRVHIRCNSRDRGAIVRKLCTVGCIACRLCVKECPREAISFADNLARIDYARCDNCQACVKVCPMHTIAVLPERGGAQSQGA